VARDLYGEPGPNAAPAVDQAPPNPREREQWSSPPAANRDLAQDAPYGREPQRAGPRPWQERGAPPPAAVTNELDAPAAEFAPPEDEMARHHRDLGRTPTPDGTYTAAPNDSFWTISQKVYGTGSYFKAIQRHNRKPGSKADGLEIGEKIMVPPVEVLQQKYPDLCPKPRGLPSHAGRALPTSSQGNPYDRRIYVVEEGDTLFDIARYELGKASRWAEIYELNRAQLGTDYNYLPPGMKLVLPDDDPREPEAITSRPGVRGRQ
jgi:nucleoid-associated protein YgaU